MTNTERRLLGMFLGVAAVAGGIIMSHSLIAWGRGLEHRESQAEMERTAADALLAGAPGWKARGAWLDAHQPLAVSDVDADAEFDTPLVTKAKAHGLEILNRQFIEPVKGPDISEFGVSVTVRGDLAGVFGWICEMQSPENFLVVPSIKITPPVPVAENCALKRGTTSFAAR